MDFLSNLMGGGSEGRREEYRDFEKRYEQGAPHEGISDEEAANRYREVAPNLSGEDYRSSAREAFERMSPQEREEFGKMLRSEAQQQGHGDFIDKNHDGKDDRFQDPEYLAGTMGQMHEEKPDLLGKLMGGAMGGSRSTSGGGGIMGGSRGASGGGIMGNPVARSAMAGIAAMAVRRITGRR